MISFKFLLKFKPRLVFFILFFLILNQCGGAKTSSKNIPVNATERARQAVNEGKGISIGGLIGKKGSTNYEFSTSNPMWRASLEVLDFLPLSVVDYSGGMLITDWYSDDANSGSSLKITLRFLSNEIRSDSIKVIIHEKQCSSNSKCRTKLLQSKIQQELLTSIIRKAAVLEKEKKKKK